MTESKPVYEEWQNINSSEKYPFSDLSSLTNGEVEIPVTTFVDARVYTVGGTERQYLSRITKTATEITLVVSEPSIGEVAFGSIVITDIATIPVELIELVDNYGRTAGVLVTDADRLGLLTALPIGTHTFAESQTTFAPSVVTPIPNTGARGIEVDDDQYYGDVWLVGGLGVVLTHEYTAADGDVIYINIVGEPLSKRALCLDSTGDFVAPTSVAKLNIGDIVDVNPDEYGDFKIGVCAIDVEDPVLRVVPDQNGLVFEAIGGRFD